jgi:hypothetical protein
MINNLPSIYEVVTGTAKKESKEKTPKSSNKTNKSGSKVYSFFYHIPIVSQDNQPPNSMILLLWLTLNI